MISSGKKTLESAGIHFVLFAPTFNPAPNEDIQYECPYLLKKGLPILYGEQTLPLSIHGLVIGGLGIGGGRLGIWGGTDCFANPIGLGCGGLIMATRCPNTSMNHSSVSISFLLLRGLLVQSSPMSTPPLSQTQCMETLLQGAQ